MSAVESVSDERGSPADVIGGLMAMASLVLSGIAMGLGILLELEARPCARRAQRSCSLSSPR